ncbi:Phospholipid ABC transporter permease protein MlaE [hydrothermal vent metagenome]|uniref:Phospholipid ABC transporter permease protein MlaE n=1 Tax=hydrothermal vent metagenome TaxID=652676 RepID=A0A3B0RYQ7_9ZZZZ
MNPIAAIGRGSINMLRTIGQIGLFTARCVLAMLRPPWFFGQIARQLMTIGYFSLPVVGLTAVFTGAALALNIYTGGARFNAESFVPNIVGIGITRELGPVLASLMLAGRVSAAIAAEIGAMKVTEQIDALRTLSTDPFSFLFAPRLIAALIAVPLLVLIADILGIFGGFAVATQSLGFNGSLYVQNTMDFITSWDVASGLIKATVFGFLIALMGCYHGYTSGRGAQGVGRATTNAVVSAAILIFTANYLLTSLFV